MCGNERGELMLAMKSRNESENRFRRLTVQVPSRLIGEQQLGPSN